MNPNLGSRSPCEPACPTPKIRNPEPRQRTRNPELGTGNLAQAGPAVEAKIAHEADRSTPGPGGVSAKRAKRAKRAKIRLLDLPLLLDQGEGQGEESIAKPGPLALL